MQAPSERTARPYLPAAIMAAGVCVEATAILKCGSVYGARCRRASRISNQSVFIVTGSSHLRRRVMASRDSSMRRRWVEASMHSM